MVGAQGIREGHTIEVKLVRPGGRKVPQDQVDDGVFLAVFTKAGGDVGRGEEVEAIVHHPVLNGFGPGA
jgi:hypothetical protein